MIQDLPRFHYVTSNNSKVSYKKLIEDACMAGVELIHLKVEGLDYDEWLDTACHAREYCEIYGAKLVVHNHPRIAKEANAYALYLNKGENPSVAREMIGADVILGASAHSREDVLRLIEEGVDYIGIGPYGDTSDPSITAEPLGMETLTEIVQVLDQSFFKLPLIAFGGILIEDVEDIMAAGVYGIAVSDGITNAGRRQLAAQDYLALVEGAAASPASDA